MSGSGGNADDDKGRPGPVYDAAARGTVEGALEPMFAVLGLPLPRSPGSTVLQATEFAGPTLRADLLVRVDRTAPAGGNDQILVADGLVHMEYETYADKGMARRMLEYRGRVATRHPDQRVRQYVLVLGDGTVDSCDDPEAGFSLGLRAIYLRDRDPVAFLADPATAPLAVLAAGNTERRKRSLVAALRLILTKGGARTAELLEHAVTLAAIRLETSMIDEAWKECMMSVEAKAEFHSRFVWGQELLRQGRAEGEARGRAEGEAQGRAEGEAQGRAEGEAQGRAEGEARGRVEGEALVLTALLRTRFGDHPDIPAVAARLARWPDPQAAVHAVTGAASIDDIPAAESGPPAQRQA